MTFKNYLIVASKLDKAGINITTSLSQYQQGLENMENSFKFYLIDREIINADAPEDLEKYSAYDFIIFASKHKSESNTKTLSIHAPGNWRSADLGGKEKRVSMSSAVFMKQAFQKLRKNIKQYDLDDYNLTLECTHHGPFIDKPCMFIEIGSTENEWNDKRAAFVIAKTIADIIKTYKENPYNEVAVGIGGPHYCPGFNKIQLNSNFAISHIIPEYSLPLSEEMIKEAISRTFEELDLVILDWKGLGNSEARQQVLNVLSKLYIRYEKTSDIST